MRIWCAWTFVIFIVVVPFLNADPMSLRAPAKQSSATEKVWIASACAQERFGGRQARHSSRSDRRRVVANAPRNDAEREPIRYEFFSPDISGPKRSQASPLKRCICN